MVARRLVLVTLSAGLLGSGCALIGLSPKCDGTEIIGEFRQVGDLVKNSNVQSSDVVIGLVNDIKLDGWIARVTMCIEEDQRIPRDTEATIRTTSLLGEKFVDLKISDSGPPYLDDGDIIDVEQTGKATELEDVFARLATILGTGNLEDINKFTASQAKILREHSGDIRVVLRSLREFTDTLAEHRGQFAATIDTLDDVSNTILDDSETVATFLESFADSSRVLADQKDSLSNLLVSLDRFSDISLELLSATEGGLREQFSELRPVLKTLVANTGNLELTLQTLATFTETWPETMPGDYLQLDVCQAMPDSFGPGTTCPQSDQNDDPDPPAGEGGNTEAATDEYFEFDDSLERLLRQPLRGEG